MKEIILKRLYDAGHITFDEMIILAQKETIITKELIPYNPPPQVPYFEPFVPYTPYPTFPQNPYYITCTNGGKVSH